MSEHSSGISERTNPDDSRGSSSEPSLLRLLRQSGEYGFIDGELRRELENLFDLLYRIDQLIDRNEHSHAPRTEEQADETDDQLQAEPVLAPQPDVSNDEFHIGGHILAFDPAEFTRPPLAASPLRRPATEPIAERGSSSASEGYTDPTDPDLSSAATAKILDRPERTNRSGQYQTFQDGGDEQLERWWVNFNGDVSLERLARLRQILGESPFTIEVRFEEISEGLIILRVVTDRKLTEAHVDWIVRQVMGCVGLNRDAAILSSRKEKSGGHRWDSTAIS